MGYGTATSAWNACPKAIWNSCLPIIELDHLVELPDRDNLVIVGGCFDPLHGGHLDYFYEARKHGTVLCCVAPDEEVAAKHPPLLKDYERTRLINAFDPAIVKYTHLARSGIAHVLREVKPKVYIKGVDWQGQIPADQQQVCDALQIPILYTDTKRYSSSQLLTDYTRALDAHYTGEFERFVSQQVPADKPWEPVTPYDFEARKQVEGPHAVLIADVFSPSSVLDVGCGAGHLLTLLRAWHDAHKPMWCLTLEGCDVRQAPRNTGWSFVLWDVVADRLDGPGNWYDLVICREVLEHLTVKQIRQAVRNLVRLSSRYVYVTTRYCAEPQHLLDVQGSDDLDPTHISMLSKDFLRTLFVLEGCTSRPDLEARMDWKGVGRCLVFEVGA